MSTPSSSGMPLRWAAACLVVLLQAGCTSALTATYLRDGLWTGSEHASEAGETEAGETEAAADEGQPAPQPAPAGEPADPEAEQQRREAALEEAMGRLSRLGTLDAAAESALVATLQRTQPEDWPVVVEEFAASLAASGPTTPAPDAPSVEQTVAISTPPTPTVTEPAAPPPPTTRAADAMPADEQADDDAATGETATTDEPVSEQAAASSGEPAPAAAEESPPTDAAVAETPTLAVRTACFASAVRAWGDLDRFDADRFQPGQEVIVYVELDNLASGESPAGHTTCIDTALALVDADGRPLHAWNFDPVAETCPGRRRDYFARYVLRIPESSPTGGCRIELAVTDTLAGSTATATLPLEVVAAQ